MSTQKQPKPNMALAGLLGLPKKIKRPDKRGERDDK